MLIAGMDVSGDPQRDNYDFLAIIMGTLERIDDLYNRTGPHNIHMSGLDGQQQKRIIDELVFDDNELIAFCIRLDRDRIIQQVIDSRRIRRKNIPHGNILRTFNRIVMQGIRSDLNACLLKHDQEISQFQIECEHDCLPFARSAHLQPIPPSKARAVADRVAWCNNKIGKLATVREIDFVSEIPEKMIRILT